jgi:hypothetical protein
MKDSKYFPKKNAVNWLYATVQNKYQQMYIFTNFSSKCNVSFPFRRNRKEEKKYKATKISRK